MNKFTAFITVFILLILVGACNKYSSSKSTSKADFYFSGDVAGQPIKFEVTDNSSLHASTSFEQKNSTHLHRDYYEGTVVGETNDGLKNNIYVTLLKSFNNNPRPQDILNMLHTGDFGYGVGEESNATINGAVIIYFDENGKQWSSELGPQIESKFSISEVSNYPGSSIKKIFKAGFSCKLYDEDGKNSIAISNASIRGLAF